MKKEESKKKIEIGKKNCLMRMRDKQKSCFKTLMLNYVQ